MPRTDTASSSLTRTTSWLWRGVRDLPIAYRAAASAGATALAVVLYGEPAISQFISTVVSGFVLLLWALGYLLGLHPAVRLVAAAAGGLFGLSIFVWVVELPTVVGQLVLVLALLAACFGTSLLLSLKPFGTLWRELIGPPGPPSKLPPLFEGLVCRLLHLTVMTLIAVAVLQSRPFHRSTSTALT